MRISRRLGAWLLLPALSGCIIPGPGFFFRRQPARTQASAFASPYSADYRTGVGDRLLVTTARHPRGKILEVEADGEIPLDAGERLRVDGLTTDEIKQCLVEWDEDDAASQVMVADCNSQFLHLFGLGPPRGRAVTIPYRGRETVEQALQRAGCFACRRGYRIRVVRSGNVVGGAPEVLTTKLDEALLPRVRSNRQIWVEPDDFIYVEIDVGKPSRIARLFERLLPLGPATGDPAPSAVRQNDRPGQAAGNATYN